MIRNDTLGPFPRRGRESQVRIQDNHTDDNHANKGSNHNHDTNSSSE